MIFESSSHYPFACYERNFWLRDAGCFCSEYVEYEYSVLLSLDTPSYLLQILMYGRYKLV